MTAELLRSDVDGLGVLCARAADWYARDQNLRVSAAIVEKDFWVTEALRVLALGGEYSAPTDSSYPVKVRAVFKGGTSLSKAYRLIDRFSEDIDVFLDITQVPYSVPAKTKRARETNPAASTPPFQLGASRVDTVMKSVADQVAQALGVASEGWGTSRTGTKRGFRFSYPRPKDVAPLDETLKEGVILELVRMGTPTPNAHHELRSMLSDWAAMTGAVALADFDELLPFSMDVLAPERTLVDKLCILHDLGCVMRDDPAATTGHHARHYYDVHQLLTSDSVLQSLAATPNLVADYANTAAKESVAVRRPGIERPDGGFAASPAFADDVLARVRGGYDAEMRRLGFGTFPALDRIAELAQKHAASL